MKLSVVAAINDEAVLARDLADSDVFREGVEFGEMRNYSSASIAYNAGLSAASGNVVVFCHQDVYLPSGWLKLIEKRILEVEAIDSDWGVIGVYGVTPSGQHVGRCWSTGLGRILENESAEYPCVVASVDELVIIVRAASGIRFDESLPGFHLYGTDIVQTSRASGHGAYVVHAPVVHNSRAVRTLAGAYTRSYRYMQRKWKTSLPLPTVIVAITRYGYPLVRSRVRKAISLRQRAALDDVGTARSGREIARDIGFE